MIDNGRKRASVRAWQSPMSCARIALLVSFWLLACSGERSTRPPAASSPVEVAAEPNVPPPPSAAPAFQFRINSFNWEVMGSELIIVSGDRTIEHINYEMARNPGFDAPQWYRRRAEVSEAAMTGLLELLVRESFNELEPLYIDRNMHDGANASYTLIANGVTKKVKCSNKFPDAVRTLEKYVREHMVDVIPKSVPRELLTHPQADALTRDD
jgi:hypothetical protein